MFKKTFTSFLLFIYLVVSSLSFADEAIIEIITESPVVSDMSTSSEIPQEITKEQNIAPETIINNIIPANSDNTASEISDSAGDILHKDTSSDVLGDNNSITLPSAPEDIQATENEGLNTAEILSGELLPTTEEIPTTEPVMVEENSIFTPPGPEPEPWQPAVIVDPTTDNVPV